MNWRNFLATLPYPMGYSKGTLRTEGCFCSDDILDDQHPPNCGEKVTYRTISALKEQGYVKISSHSLGLIGFLRCWSLGSTWVTYWANHKARHIVVQLHACGR